MMHLLVLPLNLLENSWESFEQQDQTSQSFLALDPCIHSHLYWDHFSMALLVL